MVGWYYNYLKKRHLLFSHQGDTFEVETNLGFPQGGVCSAKFWLIAFDPAIHIINKHGIEGNGYADDCAAVFGGPDMDTIQRRMQRMLDNLVVWGESCNLRFNPTKSVAMIFDRGRKNPSCQLNLGGVPMMFVDSVKYLGITLDSKLHWNLHVADRVAKAKRFLMKMAAIAKQVWGPKPYLMRWVFTCVVRPMMTYGCVVWAHEADRYAKKLRQVNRLALCTLTKFPRSTPTQMLEIVGDIFPAHIYVVKEAVCAFVRLLPIMRMNWDGFNGNINYSVSHRKTWFYKVEELGLNDFDLGQLDTCFEINHTFAFRVWLESFTIVDFVSRLPVAEWHVYTDGSKSADGVGAAYRILRNGMVECQGSARISDHSSVFQAEVYAINLAVSFILTLEDVTTVRFFVDSQAALRALCSSTIESLSVLSVVRKLNNVPGIVDLVWVKAHVGNIDNEAVDAAAKAAISLQSVDNQLVSKVYLRNQVLDKLRQVWDNEWSAYREARQSKQFFNGQCKIKAKEMCRLSRFQLGKLIRVTSGHNQLGYHQHVIYPYKSPACRYCDANRETFAHWIDDCPAFDRERQEIFNNQRVIHEYDWDVNKVLAFSKIPRIKSALSHFDPVGDDQVSDVDSGSYVPASDSSFTDSEVGSDTEMETEVDDGLLL